MIVHHFGQRKKRRRKQRDQKPEQTETDHACLLENGSHDRGGDEKNDERTRPEARIVSRCKGIEIVVGGEPLGQKNVLGRAAPHRAG